MAREKVFVVYVRGAAKRRAFLVNTKENDEFLHHEETRLRYDCDSNRLLTKSKKTGKRKNT